MAARACYWSQGGQTKEADTDVYRATRGDFGYLYFCICLDRGIQAVEQGLFERCTQNEDKNLGIKIKA